MEVVASDEDASDAINEKSISTPIPIASAALVTAATAIANLVGVDATIVMSTAPRHVCRCASY